MFVSSLSFLQLALRCKCKRPSPFSCCAGPSFGIKQWGQIVIAGISTAMRSDSRLFLVLLSSVSVIEVES